MKEPCFSSLQEFTTLGTLPIIAYESAVELNEGNNNSRDEIEWKYDAYNDEAESESENKIKNNEHIDDEPENETVNTEMNQTFQPFGTYFNRDFIQGIILIINTMIINNLFLRLSIMVYSCSLHRCTGPEWVEHALQKHAINE